MTTVEYNNRKNDILLKYYDLYLIPPQQNVEVATEKHKLSMRFGDSGACIYCKEYERDGCIECPIFLEEDMRCDEEDTAYNLITHGMGHSIIGKYAPWHNELKDLIDEYNKDVQQSIE